ncbi:MAG: hypothetical protein IJE89_02010 [Bacilli bacterium]|nr:hypothetical protein [Bacilli bacterium]
MLNIDNDMLKLAKMQERLLKATESNRENNLNNYKKTVMQVDSDAFASLLEELKHIEEHNQSLEEELQFLESIKSGYDQLNELQLSFRNVCEFCGDYDLKLSDLSQINIEYVINRINVINGYLINLRNIEINKNRLQDLNEQLVVEEKKKDYLETKLRQLELSLRESFLAAEGRKIVDGKLQYTSVVDEYKKLGIDISVVLDDTELLKRMLVDIDKEKSEVGEKFGTAEICYNNFPNAESKQILDEIRIDFFNVKYRLTMLKILELLSFNYTNYDLFKEKREKILDLIKYRLSCLESLGVHISIDPFSRTKAREQLDSLTSLTDNSKIINRIRKEISQLTDRTEEMINQNSNYLISLGDTKDLLVSKISISDIDVSLVELSMDRELDITDVNTSGVIEDNQVIDVRVPTDRLNMSIVAQKTKGVIKRVNQMVNNYSLDVTVKSQVDEISPKLVIVPNSKVEEKNTVFDSTTVEYDDIFMTQGTLETKKTVLPGDEEEVIEGFVLNVNVDSESDIFETMVPFSEPIRFEEKTDGSLEQEQVLEIGKPELSGETEATGTVSETIDDSVDQMPEAFWVTESEEMVEEVNDEEVLSFDDQINMLLSDQGNMKTRKLEADKSTRKAA